MQLTEIISIVVNLVLGSGVVGLLMFYRAKRRSANAEATGAEHSAEGAALRNMHESLVEWKEIAEAREEKLNARELLIDRLYNEKNDDRKAVVRLTTENMKIKLELQTASFKMCLRRGCDTREPNSGY